MKKFCFVLLAIAFLIAPAMSQAAQFSILGPRALGMGGASVAAVNDSTAVYWNPAALADFKKLEVRIPASLAVRDHMGLEETWDRVNNIYSLASSGDLTALTKLLQLILDLDKPNTGTDLDGSTGLLVSIPFTNSAIAVSGIMLFWGGLYPTVDTFNTDTTFPLPADSIVNNNTTITGIGLGTLEPTISFATSLGEKIFIGANAKMVYASTFVHSEKVTSNNFDSFKDSLDKSEVRSDEASVDAGILIVPTKSFSIGVVGRYLNSPSFPIEGRFAQKDVPVPGDVTISPTPERREVELKPQVRVGVALKPFERLTLSADYDITKNKSVGIPCYEDQTAAVGAELTLPAEIVSLRAGAYKNTADSDANIVYTAGVGVRLFFLRVDVAGAYDFDDREYQASVDLAFRF